VCSVGDRDAFHGLFSGALQPAQRCTTTESNNGQLEYLVTDLRECSELTSNRSPKGEGIGTRSIVSNLCSAFQFS
jgi:hypothetical protein